MTLHAKALVLSLAVALLWLACISSAKADFFEDYTNGCDVSTAEAATYVVVMHDPHGKIASIGTAIAYSPTEAITAQHVVMEAPEEPFDDSDDIEYQIHIATDIGMELLPTYVIKEDHELDLAILAGRFEHYVNFAQKLPKRFEDVWALGFANAAAKILTRGRLQSLRNEQWISTAHLAPGNSGGALLTCRDGEFEIIGINQEQNYGISYSMSAGTVQYFIEDL